jgi:Helix-turn-helix domain
MLRIHFSIEDLARVRVARTPDPMWETVLSLRVLGQPRPNKLFERWRRHTLGRLTQPMLRLREFVSSFDHWPDFLTPTNGGVSPERAVTQILATSPHQVRTELLVAPGTSAWVAALVDDGSALRQLGEVMLSYFRIGLAPYWRQILAAADGARARLARTLIDDSIERMLVGLWPDTSWQPPVLRVPYSGRKDLILAGRELILLPSFFSSQSPIIRQDPALPPVLVFSIHDAGRGNALCPGGPLARPATGDKLAALLGRTRAAVLETVSTACTTSELARRVGISLASASQHATILREAGLLATTRHRNAVMHTTTALGNALMNRPRGLVAPDVSSSTRGEHMPAAPVGR